jgi:hypothetical protein
MTAALQIKITSWGYVKLDKKELKALMRSAGNDVRTKTARLISQTSGGGRTYSGGGGSGAYRGGYKAGRYTASAAGEPPVAVTGSLKKSLRTYVFKDGDGFAVRERQFYSLFLEAGAKGGGNFRGSARRAQARRNRRTAASSARILEPRPHLDRVMAQQEAQLESRVKKAFDQGLKWAQTR